MGNSGQFARNERHHQAHKELQLRSLTQIAREVRNLPADQAQPALEEIDRLRNLWDISLSSVMRNRLGVSSFIRYIKFQLALKKIRQNLS